MNEDQKELTLEESIKQVMQTLPLAIRNYLSQSKYSVVAKNLMVKYGLHVDQGGILEREIMLILMGIEDQNEFASSLKNEAIISDDVVRNIMTDINQEIFVPLREQMRSGAGNTQPIKSAEPMKPAMPMPSETTFRSPTPANPQMPRSAVQTPQHFHLENKIPPPTPSASPSGLASALKQVLHEGDQISFNSSEKLLEDHEEPHLDIRDKVQGVSFSGVIPPGVRFSPRPIAEIPNIPLKPSTLPLTPASAPSSTPPELAKSYVDDPYREPIDTQ